MDLDINSKNKKMIDNLHKYLLTEKHLSDNTIESYCDDIKMYLSYMESIEIKDYNDIVYEDIKRYLGYLDKEEYSIYSVVRKISSIKMFHRYLNSFYKIEDVSVKIEPPHFYKKLPVVLSIEEVNDLLKIDLNNDFDYRNKAMLEVMYATGLRVSELVNLTFDNIDLDQGLVRCYGKGNKERIVPLGEVGRHYLKLYLDEHRNNLKKKCFCDKLFLNNHGQRMTRQGLYKIIGEIARTKKIDKEITPHVLRHSFATHMIECGADIRSVQELLGHENVVTTEIYTHLANNFIKENYNEYFNRSTKEGENNV